MRNKKLFIFAILIFIMGVICFSKGLFLTQSAISIKVFHDFKEITKEPIIIEVDRGVKLVNLKYDFLLYEYDGSIPKNETDLRHPLYPTKEAAFERRDGKYITYLPDDLDDMVFLSNHSYLAHIYTVTLEHNGEVFIYNFMIPKAYFSDENESR